MASAKTNKNILFYKKWDEETAKAWLKKIFDHYDVNNDGFLERSEVNDWRKKTTHPKFFEPFEDDDEWREYLKHNFDVDLTDGEAKISLDQLFEIQRIVDSKAMYVGGNTLFTDIWHMLDNGAIGDDSLVQHVVLRSKCSRCGELKKLIDFRGVTTDVHGEGGQWMKPDSERVCIACEGEAHLQTISRHFELNGVAFVYQFSFAKSIDDGTAREVTKLFVDGGLVGRIDYREEGRSYVARTFFDEKPVKLVTYFPLVDDKPTETFLGDARQEARDYFDRLAKRAGSNVNDLALILSDMFLFPNPYQVADIFGLDDA